MAYAMDLRKKVITAYERGESVTSVAAYFGISDRTVHPFKRRHREDCLELQKNSPQNPTKLTSDDMALIARVLTE